MPKAQKKEFHTESLLHQIENENAFQPKKTKSRKNEKNLEQEEKEQIVDPKTTKKILNLIKEQQNEIMQESNETAAGKPIGRMSLPNKDFDEDEEDEDQGQDDEQDYEDWDGHGVDNLDIDQNDDELIEKFINGNDNGKKKMSLSEMIMSKIATAQADAERVKQDKAAHLPPGMNPKVVEVYTKVGMLLSRYKSGPLPKTFKIIPTLRDWEEVLYITNPAEWTPQAVYQATRIFTSNLKAKMAQRFFSIILLDRVRQDIQDTKKLNYHLYMALKKSLYKPAAFFKGFLLPLCESGDCTLREAAIIGSVLVKVSVPVLHSAAALLKIAEMEYTGPNSLFIRILLDKKYALPYKVIDSLVFHFLAFKQDPREMPVLWHQSLMVFAQRYKEDVTPDQKDAIMELIKVKTHFEISAEIRRELQNSVCRGELKPEPDVEMEMEE